MRIDAHQHFWSIARGDYSWMSPELTVLYRDYLPDDLRPHLKAAGIDHTIVVQAADTEAETDFMLGLAEQTDFIAGVVGWLDMEDPAFAAKLARLRQQPKFVGIRPMLQDIADDAYILRPAVIENLRHVAESGVAFDILTLPRHLPYVLEALDLVPDLRAVVDHISKPPIASGMMEPWKQHITAIAAHRNVFCKLSGMATEADPLRWTTADLAPYVSHVVASFGPERLMFGSDWPVALLAGSYERVIGTLHELLAPDLDQRQLDLVFGETAASFYDLQL